MKRLLVSILIAVCFISISAAAQIQTCTVFGTVYLANGQPFVGAKITVHRVRAGSVTGPLLSAVPVSYLTDAQGSFSFLLPRDSYAWIEAPIDSLFVAGGVAVFIPNAGSVELRTMLSNVKLPQQVQVAILNPQSVMDPGGNGFVVRNALNVTIPRSIAVGSNLSVSNANGVDGNPSIGLGPNVVTSVVNDTNVQGSIAGNALTFAWAGTLSKARQNSLTVYNDQANTFSAGAQDFGAAASLKVPTGAGAAPTANGLIAYDTSSNRFKGGANGVGKTFAFTDSNITGTAAALTANGTNCTGNNFALGVDAAGNAECTQPAFSNLSGSPSLAQLPFGSANQLYKTNTGGTAIEQATLSVGTSGTNFAVAFGAGTITLNLPDASASARGAVTTGAQTIAGDKTLSGNTIFGGTLSQGGGAFTADGSGNLMAPRLAGGSGVSSTLAIRSTTGNGSSDAILFQVGNNGATEAARFTTAGRFGVGTGSTVNGLGHFKQGPQWSSSNFGAVMVLDGSRNNAIGILDASSTNPWAIANVAGDLQIAKMPALGDTGNPPITIIRVTISGITNLLQGGNVASASTIVPTGNLFHVTGTTTITSVDATGLTSGTTITIIFDGIVTFTDGSNLKLNGNFVTSADDSITLVLSGSNWYEVARSVN